MIGTYSLAIIPLLVAFFVTYGAFHKVPVYETFTEGAKEGFEISIRIIPYLIAMMVAVAMFRASGALDLLALAFEPILEFIGMPADLLPLAITRSLSGSGARGIFAEIATNYGGNAPITKTAAVMLGSSETTFYVLTVYFGAVGIKKYRYALLTGICADIIGIVMSVVVARVFFC